MFRIYHFAVIPWDDSNKKKAKDRICRKLGGLVFLNSDDQSRDFPRFLGMVDINIVFSKLLKMCQNGN